MRKIGKIWFLLVNYLQTIGADCGTLYVNSVKLLQLTRSYRKLYLITGSVVIVMALLPYLESLALGKLLEQLTTKGTQVWLWSVLVAFLGLLIAIFSALQYFLKLCLDRRLFQFLAPEINRRVASLPLAIHENKSKKDLITKAQESGMWYATEFMQRFPYLLQSMIRAPIALALIAAWNWHLALLLVVVSVPRFLASLYHNNRLWRISNETASSWRKFWYARSNLIDHKRLTEVKLYQNVNFFADRMGELLNFALSKEVSAEKKYMLIQLPALVVFETGMAATLLFFVVLASKGQITIGELSALFGIIVLYRLSIADLIQNLGSQFRDGKFVTDVFAAFDLDKQDKLQTHPGIKLNGPISSIVFDNVWFKYPYSEDCQNDEERPTDWVLTGLCLTISAGSSVGLVAPNGSGKTTLMKLLCRLYAPNKGRILVNGIDLQQIDIDWWQEQVGILLQEFSHYESLELGTAISLGRSSVASNENDWLKACSQSDATELVSKLPYGFSTTIGKGHNSEPGRDRDLSGGQHQKVAKARLDLRNAQLAIYDEPTSALDGEAESRVFNSIYNDSKNTRIIISHRLSTLKKADQIVVLEKGRISEAGNHEQLMEQNGLYKKLFEQQARNYDT